MSMNMKRGLLMVVVVIFLAGMVTAVSARSGISGDSQIMLLKPGQSLAVLCDGGAMPNVSYLRVGGVRVMCPEVAP